MPDQDTKTKMSELQVLTTKRSYVRQRITKICSTIMDENVQLTTNELSSYSIKVKDLQEQIRVLDESILTALITNSASEQELQEQVDSQEMYEDKLISCLSSLQSNVGASQVQSSQNSQQLTNIETGMSIREQKPRLPEIKLPTYCHDPSESLEKFIYNFENILSKHTLSSYEKFLYLRSTLSKSPKVLIDSLDVAEQTYEKAKELLTEAFGSVITQQYEILRKLSEMKLSLHSDPYSFIGEMRTVTAAFANLDIKTETVLQYFFWHALNDKFQNQLIMITNKNKPSLEEINANIFAATERYLKLKNTNFSTGSRAPGTNTSNLAVGVKTEAICSLCKFDKRDSKHHIRNCKVYETAYKRVNKLKSVGGCIKCAFVSHETKNCKYKFPSKCLNCKFDHMTYLCLKSGERSGKSSKATVNTLSTVTAHSGFGTDDAIILPTFTSSVKRADYVTDLRCLKDSGCQRNFIRESIARALKLKVLDSNVRINVTGFNEQKLLNTKLVEINIKVGPRKHKIEALCIPNIPISMTLENLNTVADAFVKKGYTLADKSIKNSDTIADIDLIIGADADQMLEMQYVNFGTLPKSCYINSTAGVMLTGSIPRLMNNLCNLPIHSIKCKNEQEQGIASSKALTAASEKPGAASSSAVEEGREGSSSFGQESLCANAGKFSLEDATVEELQNTYKEFQNYDANESCNLNDTNVDLTNFVLQATVRDETGRLTMPLLWDKRVSHLLSTNYNMAKSILYANLKKLKTSSEKLLMYDAVLKEQIANDIIEEVNLQTVVDNNEQYSFLPHMGVFKLTRTTTKCRIVYLSNLAEKSKTVTPSISHNQAILPGPNLNNKINTALLYLRFDKFLLVFDLVKAFLSIALEKCDQNRLMMLWFKNVAENDLTLVTYRCKRLCFGLRCSPCLLMLALYKILILDNENDSAEIVTLKQKIYHAIYMDNGGVSTNDETLLLKYYELLPKIFDPYCFALQQFVVNKPSMQMKIDEQQGTQTEETVKLLGVEWNRINDTIQPVKINVNENANTKRQILSTMNEIYDLIGVYLPLLNRAKLFLQTLQTDHNLEWDDILSNDRQRDWANISKQLNSVPGIPINRSVGGRAEGYSLIAFTDASTLIYGAVVYLRNCDTGTVSFVAGKNKLISKSLAKQSVPTLELQALTYGVEILMELKDELAGDTVVNPINIKDLHLFTDSMVCIHWLTNYCIKFEKMQKRSNFVLNRLKAVDELCQVTPVQFHYIEGYENPADYVTRPISIKLLEKTNYLSGPTVLNDNLNNAQDIGLTVPQTFTQPSDTDSFTVESSNAFIVSTVPVVCELAGKYSSFDKLVRVTVKVLQFIENLKKSVNESLNRNKYLIKKDDNLHIRARTKLILGEQMKEYPEIFKFFAKGKKVEPVPNLMSQLNLFLDENNLIRVQAKFTKSSSCPILLPRKSDLTKLIISSTHHGMQHAGIYSVLAELRREFHITRAFSTVRAVLRACVTCKRYNSRPIKLNQNLYKEFRVSPEEKPFSSIFIDYAGPWVVTLNGTKCKVYLLVITCLWSRAVQLQVCRSATVEYFLRALQIHIYKHGIFSNCLSDLGSQFTAGFNQIVKFLDDAETKQWLHIRSIKPLKFQQYPKGNSALGSLVETIVKQTKRLLNKAIGRVNLDFFQFEVLVEHTINLLNNRPVAFKEALSSNDSLPEVITPAMLMRGYSLYTTNIVPAFQIRDYEDPDYAPETTMGIKNKFAKLIEAKRRLQETYQSEFLAQLTQQATDKKERYRKVAHTSIQKGDVVLLKDEYIKPIDYSLGVVRDVKTNDLGEVTAAKVFKGDTREFVFRHSSNIIPLLSNVEDNEDEPPKNNLESTSEKGVSKRAAAAKARQRNKALAEQFLL